MYKRTFTVQKNPTKLFENGLLRLGEVQGLYIPLRLLVATKVEGTKDKDVKPNDKIKAVRVCAARPEVIPKDSPVYAIEEFEEVRRLDDEDRKPRRIHANGLGTNILHPSFIPPYCDRDYECFTFFALNAELDEPHSFYSGDPLVTSLSIEVCNRDTIENLLRTIPVKDGGRFATPMQAALFDVTIEGEDRHCLEKASQIIFDYFKKLQDPQTRY